MYICYIDESGGTEAPNSNPSATPLMLFAGLIIPSTSLAPLTADFLSLKRRFYPHAVSPRLDAVLAEIKGSNLRKSVRSSSHRKRTHAIGVLDGVLRLVERYGVRLVGRVWVKHSSSPLQPNSTYTYAVQDIARHFNHFLAARGTRGLVICDSRDRRQDVRVAHSVFTQKHRKKGDALPHLVESTVFGRSENFVGLQLADIVASAMLFPIAARVYCASRAGLHTHQNFDLLRARYSKRLRALQHLYRDLGGRWLGGVVVSDKLGRQPSRRMLA